MTGKRGKRDAPDGESRLNIPGYSPVRGVGVDRAGALVEARALLGGGRVLVRLLSPALAADRVLLKRIRRDTERLRKLQHPNLVGVIDFDERAGALITEFPAGVTLRQLIDGGGALTPEAAFVLMGDVLAGLGALHGAGVLHRDLRPELIDVDTAGAVRVRDAGVPTPPLRAGWTAGTPRYLAPELWDGADHSVASDLYAATALFHEALTAAPPFAADEVEALRTQHRSGQIDEEVLPPSARSLVLLGMATEPQARPHSAADYQHQLQTAAATFFEEGWHQTGETWLSEAAAARLMEPPPAEAAAAVLIPDEELTPLPEPEPEPKPPSRLRRRLAIIGAVAAAAFVALCVVLIGVALLGRGAGTPVQADPAASQSSPTPNVSQGGQSSVASPSESASPDEPGTSASASTSPSASGTASPPSFTTLPPTATPTHTPTPTPTPTHTPTASPCLLTPPLCI